MKESAKIFTLIMMIIFGFAFIANNTRDSHDEQVQVIPCENGFVKLAYLKSSEEDVKVSILNENGKTLFDETVNADRGFVNVYDLHNYGSGDYVLRIKDSEGYSNHEVFFNENNNLVFCELGNTGKYRLVMENANDLDINVFNKDDQLLLSNNIRSREFVNKMFDLSRIVNPEDQQQISFIIKNDNKLLKIATF